MPVDLIESSWIKEQEDIAHVRFSVRQAALQLGFSPVNQTKLVTAASEIARNALVHGGGGRAIIEIVESATRTGVRITVIDQGCGIDDIAQALTDGFTTRNGMGLGLGGSKRLCDEFEVKSTPGGGTTVVLTKWK
jgi:serine/threonine-protein kinase RsbT